MNIYTVELINKILDDAGNYMPNLGLRKSKILNDNLDYLNELPYRKHFGKLNANTLKEFLLIEKHGFDYVFLLCPICNRPCKNLGSHARQGHKIKLDVSPLTSQLWRDNNEGHCFQKGESNPAFDHGGKMSPYSKKFLKYVTEEDFLAGKSSASAKNSASQKDGGSIRTLQHWINKGLSEEDAKEALSNFQRHFSKDICIEKYGEIVGPMVWQERQDRWQETLQANPDIDHINFRKGRTYYQHLEKFGKEKADKIIESRIVNTPFGQASKESLTLFLPLMEWLDSIKFPKENIRIGIEGNSEYKLRHNDKLRMYDFVITALFKLVIEYHGTRFHPKSVNDRAWLKENRDPKFVWEYDQQKKKIIEDAGFQYLAIWGDEENKLETAKKFIKSVAKSYVT